MIVLGFKFRSVRGIFLSLTLIVVFANDKKSVVHTPTNSSSLQTNGNILRRITKNQFSRKLQLQVTSKNNYNRKNGEARREELKPDYIKSMSDSAVDERRRNVANEDGTLRRRDRRNFRRKRKGSITKANPSEQDSENVPVVRSATPAPKSEESSTTFILASIGILLVIAILVAVIKRKKIKEFLEKEKLAQGFDITEIVLPQHPKPNETQTLINKENDKSTGAPGTAATGVPGTAATGAPGTAATGVPGTAATGALGSRPTGAPSSKPTGVPVTAATIAPGSKGTGTPGIAVAGASRSKPTGAPGTTVAGAPVSKGTGAPGSKGTGVPGTTVAPAPVSKGGDGSKSKAPDVFGTKSAGAHGSKPVVLIPPGLKSKAPPEAKR